jgi:protein-tyrosine phosphatase
MDYFTAKGMAPVRFLDRHMLSVGPRPSKRLLADMRVLGITDLLTLLSEAEGGRQIGERAIAHQVNWHWLPLHGADPAQLDADAFRSKLIAVIEAFRASENPRRLHVHCSAGIHRTGMAAYGLLRLSGLEADQALAALVQTRSLTGEGMTDIRRQFVEQALHGGST